MTLNGLVIANQADGHAEVVLKDDLGQNVAKVPNGEILAVLQNGSGTAKVRWNNVDGWAKAANLKALPPVPPTNAPIPESFLPPTEAPVPESSRVCENGHHMNESANFCQHCGRRPRQPSPQALTVKVPALVKAGEADAPRLQKSITDLRRRALSSGATEAEVDDALEQGSPHEALISLIKLKQEELLASLNARTLRDLKKRAREMGVGRDTVDETDDQDDPKEAVIRLILAKMAAPAAPAPAPSPSPAAHGAAVAAMPACVICRRPTQGGFRHCCRTCESSQGRSHGPRCKAAHAAANLT